MKNLILMFATCLALIACNNNSPSGDIVVTEDPVKTNYSLEADENGFASIDLNHHFDNMPLVQAWCGEPLDPIDEENPFPPGAAWKADVLFGGSGVLWIRCGEPNIKINLIVID